MARTWPSVTELQNLLYAAGIIGAVPPTGVQSATYIDYQGALDAAREDFENDVSIVPFLADGSEAQDQYVQFLGSPTGGQCKLTYGSGLSGFISTSETATSLETILEAVSQIGTGKISVTGAAGGPYKIKFDSSLFPYNWLEISTNSLTGGTSPTISVDDWPFFQDGPRGYFMPLEDTFFSIRSVNTDRYSGGDGIARTVTTDFDYVYRRGTRGIDALAFNLFIGGYGGRQGASGPDFVQIIGRRGMTDDLPGSVFKAILAKSTLAPDLLPLFSARKSGGAQEWKEGDVSEKYGTGANSFGAYAGQMMAWEDVYMKEVARWQRMRVSGG